MQLEIKEFIDQFTYFPGTKYMGSKQKIVNDIWSVIKNFRFTTFYDAFSGSNVVSYFIKCKEKKVITNDFLSMSYINSKAIIENSFTQLDSNILDFLLSNENDADFIQSNFKNLYFSDEDNAFLDKIRYNISLIEDDYKKAIALSALVRSCMKRRPRGIFTFIGDRYDDGRQDLRKSIKEHFLDNVDIYNNAVFNNGFQNESHNKMAGELFIKTDIVYFDPPYFSTKSDNDYTRRYHFVEGLVKYWEGLKLQKHTITNKFKSYESPFSKKESAYIAFDLLFKKYQNSIILISYSSNSIPTKKEMIEILKKYKNRVELIEIDHTYSFGNQGHIIGNGSNRVKEYLFLGY